MVSMAKVAVKYRMVNQQFEQGIHSQQTIFSFSPQGQRPVAVLLDDGNPGTRQPLNIIPPFCDRAFSLNHLINAAPI